MLIAVNQKISYRVLFPQKVPSRENQNASHERLQSIKNVGRNQIAASRIPSYPAREADPNWGMGWNTTVGWRGLLASEAAWCGIIQLSSWDGTYFSLKCSARGPHKAQNLICCCFSQIFHKSLCCWSCG